MLFLIVEFCLLSRHLQVGLVVVKQRNLTLVQALDLELVLVLVPSPLLELRVMVDRRMVKLVPKGELTLGLKEVLKLERAQVVVVVVKPQNLLLHLLNHPKKPQQKNLNQNLQRNPRVKPKMVAKMVYFYGCQSLYWSF